MNQEKLQDALGLLDDDLITEVDQLRQERDLHHSFAGSSSPETLVSSMKKRHRRKNFIRWGSLAASLCILVGVSYFWAMGGLKGADEAESIKDFFYSSQDSANEAMGDMEIYPGQEEMIPENLSSADSKSETEAVNIEPPILLLLTAATEQATGAAIPATKGGYHWNYDNGDGTLTATIVDAAHPLMCRDIMNCFQVTDPAITMKFTHAPGTPKQITIRCWGEEFWGKDDPDTMTAQGEFFTSSETDLSLTKPVITLKEGGHIYLVTVLWEQGTVDYMFYADYERSTP